MSSTCTLMNWLSTPPLIGLIAGAWFGHARWLIALVAVLGLGLGISATAEHVAANRIDWRADSSQSPYRRYNAAGGNVTLDLRDLRLEQGVTKQIIVRVGMGKLTVRLPRSSNYEFKASVGAGSLDLYGQHTRGTGLYERRAPSNDAKPGLVDLDLVMGAGKLRVIQ